MTTVPPNKPPPYPPPLPAQGVVSRAVGWPRFSSSSFPSHTLLCSTWSLAFSAPWHIMERLPRPPPKARVPLTARSRTMPWHFGRKKRCLNGPFLFPFPMVLRVLEHVMRTAHPRVCSRPKPTRSSFPRSRAAGDAVDLGQQGRCSIENGRHSTRFGSFQSRQEAHIEKIKLLPLGGSFWHVSEA